MIAHFHYIVAPGTIFAVFAGIYYWFPKATGRKMNDFWGKVHFWPSLICMNVIFLPMFLQGMLGMHRRWYDGGEGWTLASNEGLGPEPVSNGTLPISMAAWVMGLAQIPFIINFFWSMRRGEKGRHQPVGSDHPGMDRTFPAAAREFHRRTGSLSRTVRIQPAGPGDGLHDANRAGPA